MLVFSIYVPPVSYRQISERVAMRPTVEEMQATNQVATSKPTRIVIARDFNRHHPALSGRGVPHQLLRYSEELLAFIHNQRLQWCLPRGMLTL